MECMEQVMGKLDRHASVSRSGEKMDNCCVMSFLGAEESQGKGNWKGRFWSDRNRRFRVSGACRIARSPKHSGEVMERFLFARLFNFGRVSVIANQRIEVASGCADSTSHVRKLGRLSSSCSRRHLPDAASLALILPLEVRPFRPWLQSPNWWWAATNGTGDSADFPFASQHVDRRRNSCSEMTLCKLFNE